MSFVHSSAVLWHCFSMVSRPYTCSLLEFYPNRASTVYRTSRIKFSHLLVPSVHCSYMYIPRYRLHTTKETIHPPGELYCLVPLILLWWQYLQKGPIFLRLLQLQAAWTSWLVILVFLSLNWFFECEHQFTDKLMLTTEPAETSNSY